MRSSRFLTPLRLIGFFIFLLATQSLFVSARTLTVDPKGGGTHTTIQAALDAATEGDTVIVQPGDYRESLIFKAGVTLRGTERGQCRILARDSVPALLAAVGCTTGTIENLTFDGEGKKATECYDVGAKLEWVNGRLRVKEAPSGGSGGQEALPPGAWVKSIQGSAPPDVNAAFYLSGCSADPGRVNLDLGEAGQVTVQLEKKNTGGWFLPDGIFLCKSSITVRNCVVRNVPGEGIIFDAGSTGLASGSLFENCGQNGIEVRGRSMPLLIGNECRRNVWNGICSSNGGEPWATGNHCHHNSQSGILCLRGAGIIEENACEFNKWSGICTDSSASRLVLARNQCRNNVQGGIVFKGGAKGVARENVCEKNLLAGIYVWNEGTNPVLRGNTCRANQIAGILFERGAKGRAEDNHCLENLFEGICVKDKATSVTLARNECRGSLYGILFGAGAAGLAESNVCESNDQDGITVVGKGASPELRGNQLRNNGQCGILVTLAARGKVIGNVCESNGRCGIAVYGAETAVLLGSNVCRDNKEKDIFLGGGAKSENQP